MIHLVDESLERLLRARLPLPTDIGDISFDAPDKAWAARISRMTINVFLYDLARSIAFPSRPQTRRVTEEGVTELRDPLPMVTMTYLVSAWGSTPRDEHALLGDLMAVVLSNPIVPLDLADEAFPGPLTLTLSQRDTGRKPGDIWSSLDGKLRPGFELLVDVALPLNDWRQAPTLVTGTSTSVGRPPAGADTFPPPPKPPAPLTTRRRSGGSVLLEGRPPVDA